MVGESEDILYPSDSQIRSDRAFVPGCEGSSIFCLIVKPTTICSLILSYDSYVPDTGYTRASFLSHITIGHV